MANAIICDAHNAALPAFPRQGLLSFRFCARIWEMHRLAGILKFCVSGYTRFHEGERLDEGTGLAWV
jgi:hypothetical protein